MEKNKTQIESPKVEIVKAEPENNSIIANFPTSRQIEEYKDFLKNYDEFVGSQLHQDTDYGVIPGVQKPSLLKPGAEKLEKLFFLTHEKTLIKEVERDDYVEYVYKTTIYDKQGRIKATCEGSANGYESKYRYQYKFDNECTPEELANGLVMERTSKYGKPYKQVRLEKKDFYDVRNTIRKMAQKRSYVGAILEATNSSGRFTSDVEDMDLGYKKETPKKELPKTKQFPAESAIDIQKKTIMSLLDNLEVIGENPTKKDIENAVKQKTDLSLIPSNYQDIIARLKALVNPVE